MGDETLSNVEKLRAFAEIFRGEIKEYKTTPHGFRQIHLALKWAADEIERLQAPLGEAK